MVTGNNRYAMLGCALSRITRGEKLFLIFFSILGNDTGILWCAGVYRSVQGCAGVCSSVQVCAGVCSHGLTLFRYNKLALNLTIYDQGVPSLVKRR